MTALRELVPRALRHAVSAQLARARAERLDRDLAALAESSDTIVVGPWLGEVGFELLYWVPFLAWFADRFQVAPERLVIVSRGGTASWYAPFASGYRDIFDQLTPDEFRRRHDERVQANGEQKQTRVLAFERDLLRTLVPDIRDRAMLHPSTMYSLFNPFWWGHVDERWVHQRARYRCLHAGGSNSLHGPAQPYVAVKFYFNDCFPPTEENRSFVRRVVRELAGSTSVVSLTTGLDLDDHGACENDSAADPASSGARVRLLPSNLHPRDNLAVQTAIVAGASAFVGTYGGFSYLAPFLGVRSTAYFGDADGFSKRHLLMARSALDTLGAGHLFSVVHSHAAAGRSVH